MVMSWIKIYVLRANDSGLLSLPAPILTRVFQELSMGLVEFFTAQQVVIWPFPYPFTQMNYVMLHLYMLITPLVICSGDAEPWLCATFSGGSVMFMLALDYIASELENPFGEDANDLPVHEMQTDVNAVLIQCLNPMQWQPPELSAEAKDYSQLEEAGSRSSMSLQEYTGKACLDMKPTATMVRMRFNSPVQVEAKVERVEDIFTEKPLANDDARWVGGPDLKPLAHVVAPIEQAHANSQAKPIGIKAAADSASAAAAPSAECLQLKAVLRELTDSLRDQSTQQLRQLNRLVEQQAYALRPVIADAQEPLDRSLGGAAQRHLHSSASVWASWGGCSPSLERRGSQQMAVGSQQIAVGSHQVAVGSQQMAVGSHQMAVGIPNVAQTTVAVGK